jgi:hypothetical protein
MLTNIKLAYELVPSTCWWGNLRHNTSRTSWDRIRKRTYAEYDYKCCICGKSDTRLEAHEVFSYDDERHIQKCEKVISLCNMCHHIKHMGFARILVSEGKLSALDLDAHFMEINSCNMKDYMDYDHKAFRQWADRSQHDWKVDWGIFCSDIIKPEEA